MHSRELDRAWKGTSEKQLSAIASWAPTNLGPAYSNTGTMFYMFSGPDFLYAHAFFPNAGTYILVGNEPVGPMPDLEKIGPDDLAPALANIRKSLESVLSWSFFITKEMKTDLANPQLSGTLPLLYIFLARANCTIDSVTPVAIDRDGRLSEELSAGSKSEGTPGVRIVFRSGTNRESGSSSDATNYNSRFNGTASQTLYYFATDLSDDGIKNTPGLIKFCESHSQRQGAVSLLKAASYLMHEPGFSKVRQFLLDHSSTIVQDDSGIPFRYFFENGQNQQNAWDIKLWGPYLGPIDVFKQYWQQDLSNAFATTSGSPLPFGFGYNWAPAKSNLLVAKRR